MTIFVGYYYNKSVKVKRRLYGRLSENCVCADVNVDVTLIVSVDSCAKGITVFKTACDLRARLAGFDSQAVPPTQ